MRGDDYSREAIILNITITGGRLFEGGNLSRDGYYLWKYGITITFNCRRQEAPTILISGSRARLFEAGLR